MFLPGPGRGRRPAAGGRGPPGVIASLIIFNLITGLTTVLALACWPGRIARQPGSRATARPEDDLALLISSPPFAAFTVAIPLTTFMVVLGLLNNRTSVPTGVRFTLLAAALILATAAAAPILTLPASIVIMVVLVALLLAYYLTAARRAAR